MTKAKQKPALGRLPKMPGLRQWDADDRAAWRDIICQLPIEALRVWAMGHYKDRRDMYRQLMEVRRLRAEEAEFYKRELAAAKRENLGRIQSNLMQTLQSMMAAMEGNSRAVHALAEPVGDMLGRLGKEMDKAAGGGKEGQG